MEFHEIEPFLSDPVAVGVLLLDNDLELYFITSKALFHAQLVIR